MQWVSLLSRHVMSLLTFASLVAKLLLVVMIIGLLFLLLTSIGSKSIVNETITLPPGGEKTYTLPPGEVQVSLTTGTPIDETYNSLTDHSMSRGAMGGTDGMGSIAPGEYVITNPTDKGVVVNMQITTGVLNPFGYIF